MITGVARTEQRTELEYRRLDIDSSSSLKDFADSRKKYYKKYIVGEIVEEEDNHSILMGRLTETMLFEEHRVDEKFVMSMCSEAPTGLMLSFCNELYKAAISCMDDEGILTKTTEELTVIAHSASGYKRSLSWVLEQFIDKEPEKYFREMLASKPHGKSVISTESREIAEKIASRLRTNEFTKFIFEHKEGIEVLHQLQIEGFEIDGLPLKSMLDIVFINHNKKIATVIDLKCSWAVEEFYSQYYLYRKAYIQGYVYYHALRHWLNQNGYEDYTLTYPTFLVADSTNQVDPLLYPMSPKNYEDAYLGFIENNRNYQGVKSVIEELKWCKENNIWTISKNNYLNKGIAELKF